MRDDGERLPNGDRREGSGRAVHGDGGGLRSGSDRNRLDDFLSQRESLPDLEKALHPEQPHVQNGYWETIAPPIAGSKQARVRDGISLSVTLEDLVPKSLVVIGKILDTDLDANDPNFARLLSAQKDAAVSVLNTAVKADENRFKNRSNKVIEELLERMRMVDAKTIEQPIYAKQLADQSMTAELDFA